MRTNAWFFSLTLLVIMANAAKAGSINGRALSQRSSPDAPNCDERRYVLDKCNAKVREHILNQCYVVIQNHPNMTGQIFDCTWQSCNGLSLIGQKPQVNLIPNQKSRKSTDYEVVEYGIRSYVRVQDSRESSASASATDSWGCDDTGKCLPFLKFAYPSLSSLHSGSQGQFIGRYYMTLGEAVSILKANSEVEFPERLRSEYSSISNIHAFKSVKGNPKALGTLSTNPYLDCALNEKSFVWVVHDVPNFKGGIIQYNSEVAAPVFYVSATGKTPEQYARDIDRELRRTGEWITRGRELEVCRRSVLPQATKSHCMVEFEDGTILDFKTILQGQRF